MGKWLRRVWCIISGACRMDYEPRRDPLVRRYLRLEGDVHRERFHPSELIDPRR